MFQTTLIIFFYLDCKNVISEADCQRRMMMGECANNPVFMSLNCKYSCGYCSKKISFVLPWLIVWCMHMALYWASGGQNASLHLDLSKTVTKSITTARKGILKLAKLQCFVANILK